MSDKPQAGDNYDAHITPAETAARMDREGANFGKQPDKVGSIDTTKGATVDKEGLANNYAIEPEMYVNTPGDLKEKEEAEAAERAEELEEVNEEGGFDHKGPGVI